MAEHKDINDVDQFIYFDSVHTKARDKTTDKSGGLSGYGYSYRGHGYL